MRLLFALCLCTLCPVGAAAQVTGGFTDGFVDGDFTAAPGWSGTPTGWRMVSSAPDYALRSDGPPRSDTLFLSTPSAVSYGTWRFTFDCRGVNLSNFNGARIFLTADGRDLRGPVRGYFLQLGTNNSDEIRLYRQDGDPARPGSRVELGRSATPLLEGEENTLRLEVTRTAEGWTVRADGEPVLKAIDDTYRRSRYFGLWVKHTAATGGGYVFDDFAVAGEAGPPDTTPPTLRFVEQVGPSTLEVTFSEALDARTVSPDAFRLRSQSPHHAVSVTSLDDTTHQVAFGIELQAALPRSVHLEVTGLQDRSGNRLEQAAEAVAWQPAPGDLVFNEVLFEPLADPFDGHPDQPEYVEVYNRSGGRISLRGLALAEAADETGRAYRQELAQPRSAVAPGGFVLVFEAGESPRTVGERAAAAARLAAAFPEVDVTGPALVLTPVGTVTRRGLRREGEIVRLLRSDGTELDRITYAPDRHNPTVLHAADGRGTALERIRPEGPSEAASNWTSSTAPSGGTPGRANTAAAGPASPPEAPGLTITPSPFYPEGVGEERIAVIRYRLQSEASLVRARLYDSRGRPVRTLEEAALSGAAGALLWDGLDDAGRRLRTGIYVVLLEAAASGDGTAEAYKGPVVLARPLD